MWYLARFKLEVVSAKSNLKLDRGGASLKLDSKNVKSLAKMATHERGPELTAFKKLLNAKRQIFQFYFAQDLVRSEDRYILRLDV